MLRTLALALMVMPLLLMVEANAHGPTRQKVTETVEINVPADKVWAVIGNFQDLNWHPAVEKTEGEGGNDAGAKRTLTLGGGGQIFEELFKYDADAKLIKYGITKVDVKVLPVNNYSSVLSVEKIDDGKSKVIWKGAFYRGYMNNDPPEDLNDATAIKAVKGVYRSGLDELKKKLEAAG
ncbi:MAG: SRPBCC family protein [Alphaproteobacteria bacterium]|nr:SRPBCC family protein [Alphaproteobacteria bacterium]